MFASNGLKENTRRKKRGIERGEKRERESIRRNTDKRRESIRTSRLKLDEFGYRFLLFFFFLLVIAYKRIIWNLIMKIILYVLDLKFNSLVCLY